MAHSPGPWTTDQEESHEVVLTVFSIVTDEEIAREVSPENARLIVAAPGLLAMLERIAEAEFGFGETWPGEAEVRKLIAQAKGA